MTLKFKFKNRIIYWKGPAPFYFLPIPKTESADIKSISNQITYGWGVIPAIAKVGDTEFKTALFPKDGLYLLPLKVAVRKEEYLDKDDEIEAEIRIEL